MLNRAAQIPEERQVEISMNITIRTGKAAMEYNGKEKGKVS